MFGKADMIPRILKFDTRPNSGSVLSWPASAATLPFMWCGVPTGPGHWSAETPCCCWLQKHLITQLFSTGTLVDGIAPSAVYINALTSHFRCI